jgi:hypothetical protein
MQKPPRLPVAVLLAGSLLGSLAGCHKPKPPPSIDDLSAALERSAEQSLPAPTLASEQVILPAQPGPADAQTAAVIQAASAAGGVAIRTLNPQGQPSILATIPENNADAFKALLRHEKPSMESPSSSTRLIEILIEKTAPSPSP